MENYKIERLTPENIQDILPIFSNSFGKNMDVNYLKKRYDTSMFGYSYIAYIAYTSEGVAASFFGVLPCYIRFGDKLIYAAQSVDGMTLPEHQGKGLFVALIKRTFQHAESVGVKIGFGFPNLNSLPSFVRKLDWTNKDNLLVYLIRVPCLPILRLSKVLPSLENWQVQRMSYLLSKLQVGKPFRNSVLVPGCAGVEHSTEFYSYKQSNSNYLVQVLGISVWLKASDMFLIIGDVEQCSHKTLTKVLRRLKMLCFQSGIPYLRFHCNPGAYWEDYFKTHGQLYDTSYAIIRHDLGSGEDVDSIKFTASDNDTF